MWEDINGNILCFFLGGLFYCFLYVSDLMSLVVRYVWQEDLDIP